MPGRLLPLRLYYFTSFAALGAYAPFFPRWLEARGVSGVAMGLVSGLLPAMGVLGPPAIGLFADALGLRGSLLRVACAGACLSMAALALGAALAPGNTPSFALIFGAVLAYSVFRSPMVMLADVVAMEQAPAAGATYGEVRLWGSLGFLVAAFAVGKAIDPRGGVPLPTAIALLLLVAFLSTLPLPGKPVAAGLPVSPGAGSLLRSRSFPLFLAVSLLAYIAHSAYDLCFSLHLRDLGAADGTTGLCWAAGTFFEMVLLRYAEPLIARFSAPRLLVLSIFGAAARWVLLAAVPSVPVLLALSPLHAVSFALWWVASVAHIRECAPPYALAAAQGLFSSSVAAGTVAGMLAWGALYRRAGGSAVFAAAAAVALGAAVLGVLWQKDHRKTFAPPGQAG